MLRRERMLRIAPYGSIAPVARLFLFFCYFVGQILFGELKHARAAVPKTDGPVKKLSLVSRSLRRFSAPSALSA